MSGTSTPRTWRTVCCSSFRCPETTSTRETSAGQGAPSSTWYYILISILLSKSNNKLSNLSMTKVGEQELDNLQLANMIAASLDKQLKYNLVDFHSSRPGHDLRWAEDQTESFV